MAKNTSKKAQKQSGKTGQSQRAARNIRAARPNPLAGIRDELKQVTWPTRQEATELTITVIIISLIVALFVGIIDFSLAKALEFLSQ